MRKVTPRLPAADEKKRSLLTGPTNKAEVEVEAEAEVEAEITDWKERALRAQAEAENVRARAERRAEAQLQREHRRLLGRLLTVVDNLERALAHADGDDPLHVGVQLTLEDLWGQLVREGVEPIQALGQPFDPHLHEAVATDGAGGDMVVKVLQTGYTLDGELLRPARVIVGHLT